MKDECIICGNNSQNPIFLRYGKKACKSCVDLYEREIPLLKKQISKLEESTSKVSWAIWSLYIVGVVISIATLGLQMTILLGFIGLIAASAISSNADERLRFSLQPDIGRLKDELNQKETHLEEVYSIFKGEPPDWQKRREKIFQRANNKCENCGRRRFRSRVPFHVHHKIPRSEEKGDHSLSNLQLLCEICHAKLPKHGLVREARNRRLGKSSSHGPA